MIDDKASSEIADRKVVYKRTCCSEAIPICLDINVVTFLFAVLFIVLLFGHHLVQLAKQLAFYFIDELLKNNLMNCMC